MKRWAFALALAACGGSSSAPPSAPCDQAYAKLAGLGAFTGLDQPGRTALAFGGACSELPAADVTCLAGVKTLDDVKQCSADAQRVAIAQPTPPKGEPTPMSDADLGAFADALCACKDAACLAHFGATRRADLDRAFAGTRDDASAAAMKKIGACLTAAAAPDTSNAKMDVPLGQLDALKRDACGCQDAACAQRAHDRLDRWDAQYQDRASDPRVAELRDALQTCVAKLTP